MRLISKHKIKVIDEVMDAHTQDNEGSARQEHLLHVQHSEVAAQLEGAAKHGHSAVAEVTATQLQVGQGGRLVGAGVKVRNISHFLNVKVNDLRAF